MEELKYKDTLLSGKTGINIFLVGSFDLMSHFVVVLKSKPCSK